MHKTASVCSRCRRNRLNKSADFTLPELFRALLLFHYVSELQSRTSYRFMYRLHFAALGEKRNRKLISGGEMAPRNVAGVKATRARSKPAL